MPETATPTRLAEAQTGGAVSQTSARRYRMRILELQGTGPDGGRWGSSGYYPADVVERDMPRIFGPTGAQAMYLDHPGMAEADDRPERSVRDLAARIVSTPVREADGMYADVEVYEHMAPVIEALWKDIGVSIRAAGLVEHGEAQGRQGPIVTELTAGFSVDFVTKAGAGGKITQLLESAREAAPTELAESGSIGVYVESRLHLALTQIADEMYGYGKLTRAERIALSSAIGDGLDAFTGRLESEAPALYLRDQWGDPPTTPAGADTWTGQPEAPVVEAGHSTRGEPTRLPVPPSATARAAEVGRPDRAQLLEAIRVAAVRDLRPSQIRHLSRDELARLAEARPSDGAEDFIPSAGKAPATNPEPTEASDPAGTPPADEPPTHTEEPVTDTTGATPDEAGRTSHTDAPPAPTTPVAEAASTAALVEAQTARADAERQLAEARRALSERDARDTARIAATAKVAESTLPTVAQAAVVERLVAGVRLTEAGVLDEAALTAAIEQETKRESDYLASLAEANGIGRPTGLGGSAPVSTQVSEADRLAARTVQFERLGMSPAAAATAAKGR